MPNPISIDFSEIPTYETLPTGEYPVIIEHVELRDSKQTPGNQYLNWDMIVSQGEYEGRHIFMSSGLTPKSLWHLKGTLLSLGVITDETGLMNFEVDDATNYVVDPPLAGMPAIVNLVERVKDGQSSNDVTGIRAMEQVLTKKAPEVAKPGQRPVVTQKPQLKLK